MKILEYVTLVLSVVGVVFNNYRMSVCFVLWLLSNSISLYLHRKKQMHGLALRDLIFIALAIVGWWQWTR